jgi:hypothetical protein
MKKKRVQSWNRNPDATDENREYRYAGIKLGYVKITTAHQIHDRQYENGEYYEIYKFERKYGHFYVCLFGKEQIMIYPQHFRMHIDNIIFVSEEEYLTSEVVSS